jgi:hypothetical protein
MVMSNDARGYSTAKLLLIVIVVAIVASVASTLVQHLILGKAHTAVTGGVVGALTAVMALNVMKKKES